LPKALVSIGIEECIVERVLLNGAKIGDMCEDFRDLQAIGDNIGNVCVSKSAAVSTRIFASFIEKAVARSFKLTI
jgi:gamma-glutamyl phosphate reductase